MEPFDRDDLDVCVRCGLCLSSCPTFRLTGMEGYSPRGRIRTAKAIARGHTKASAVTSEFLDTCLGCRACEDVCPSGVPYGRILEDARVAQAPRGWRRRILDTILFWLVARRWRLSIVSLPLYVLQKTGLLRVVVWLARRGWAPAVLAQAAGVPKLRLGHLTLRVSTNYEPERRARGQVVLFTGCVQDAWFRDVHWATISVLTRCRYRVRVPHGQVCCGALHAHAGRVGTAEKLEQRNVEPLEQFEGQIVVNAAGCGAKLREYDDVGSRARDWSQVVSPEQIVALGPRPPEGLGRIAYHEACHAPFAGSDPREHLRAAGYEVVDVGGPRCCGAAGTYAVHQPEWARALRSEKLDAVDTEADAVAVGNPGCHVWMAAGEDAPPIYHPVQLVAVALLNARKES